MAGGHLASMIDYLRRVTGQRESGEMADSQLLERYIATKDEAAFEVLLDRYGPMVLGVCRRMIADAHLAEDVFQATFLLLVRKAHTVRRRESLSSWLHGVAMRLAWKARTAASRQRPGEMPEMASPDSTAEVGWRDLRPLLDEEVQRLPGKCREAFVLCYLEGKSNADAARQLGCPEGTVFSRLAQARDRLRGRLTRRGVTLSAAGLTTLLGTSSLSAALPPVLKQSTMQAITGQAAVSATVAALVQGGLQMMFLTKMKTAAVLVMALVLGLGGAGLLTHQALADKSGDVKKSQLANKNPADAPKEQPPGPNVPLEVKLVAKKDTYPVPGPMNPKDPGSAARVDLVLQMRNTGKRDLIVDLCSGDRGNGKDLVFGLKGPGVTMHRNGPGPTPELLYGARQVTVQPGKTIDWPITSLTWGYPRKCGWYHWSKSGEYSLTIACWVQEVGTDKAEWKYSNAVKLKLEAEKAKEKQDKIEQRKIEEVVKIYRKDILSLPGVTGVEIADGKKVIIRTADNDARQILANVLRASLEGFPVEVIAPAKAPPAKPPAPAPVNPTARAAFVHKRYTNVLSKIEGITGLGNDGKSIQLFISAEKLRPKTTAEQGRVLVESEARVKVLTNLFNTTIEGVPFTVKYMGAAFAR